MLLNQCYTSFMKKKILLSILIILIIYIAIGLDPRLQTTHYDYTSPKIPGDFSGFQIVQISDFHLKEFGKHEEKLIQAVADCNPDIIVMTGDIVDEDHKDLSPLEDLLKGISSMAPIYYVTGNHEFESDAVLQYQNMLKLFDKYNIINLDDKSEVISKKNSSICITGAQWRSQYVTDYLPTANTDYFNILLYHGSDYFPQLSNFGYDLLLAGHSHGGIIRLPFVGGIFGNSGELFPSYAGGIHTLDHFILISSRGLGDARLPRFYNRPELVHITLYPA